MSEKSHGNRRKSKGASETKLHEACRSGDIETVRYCIENGYCIDAGSETPLHIALKQSHINIALYLLQAGADFELDDSNGDCAIHIAAKSGLEKVTQALCSLGCNLEIPNSHGLYPLHLAAKYGHIHIVRCLCAAGCHIERRNVCGIRADITALKHGFYNISDLLDKLRLGGQRDNYARQLVPTTKNVTRLVLRVFGNSGVGKSALIKSLNAGLFRSFFRRSSSSQKSTSRPSSPCSGNNVQIEMDVTSKQNLLTFETSPNVQSTKGVHIQHLDLSNVGELTVMEFSGSESYFGSYHLLFRSLNNRYMGVPCVDAILFNLDNALTIQLKQCAFWLNFLLARMHPLDMNGCRRKVIFLATHVDSARAARTGQGEWLSPDAQRVVSDMEKKFGHAFDIHPSAVVMDCNVPASYPFKQLKAYLNGVKQSGIISSIGSWSGLLDTTLGWLAQLKRDREHYPVLLREEFSELLRMHVNLLASDEHINELLVQLYQMAEIYCIDEFIIISLPWFGFNLLGELLSTDFLANARLTGVFTAEDFQTTFVQCDSTAILRLLEALRLCIQCENDGEYEFEFPCLNYVETIPGLWDPSDPRYPPDNTCYGGVRVLSAPDTCHLLSSIFPFVQLELRQVTNQALLSRADEADIDLYQWFHGSKLCVGQNESLITLEDDFDGAVECIEVKVRGPKQLANECFILIEEITSVVYQSLLRICPGLILERHVLSSSQLKAHDLQVYSWPPHVMQETVLDSDSCQDIAFYNEITEQDESLVSLVFFDSECLITSIQWGCSLPCRVINPAIILRLASLLDPPEPLGRDWCVLTLRLGLSEGMVANLHESGPGSITKKIISNVNCTIGCLITSLREIGRKDAADILLRSAPLFQITPQNLQKFLEV